jgi:amino acid transporter
MPESLGRVHPRYLTPHVSTLIMGGLSIVWYVGLTIVSENILFDSIAALGLMIAFYYGLTGFACAWEFRHDLKAPRDVLMRCVIPLLGGILLLGVFIEACIQYADPDYGYTVLFGVGGVFVIGIGTLGLGAILMFVYGAIAPAFFKGETLREGTPDLLLELPEEGPTLRLPDSHEETVIAPDRSNLPPGREPYEPS